MKRTLLLAITLLTGIAIGFGLSYHSNSTFSHNQKGSLRLYDKQSGELVDDISDLEDKRDKAVAAAKETIDKYDSVINRIERDTIDGSSGIYIVGEDISAGTYRADASVGCYYQVSADINGDDIITNGNVDGPVVVQVPASAKSVTVQDCGTFTKAG